MASQATNTQLEAAANFTRPLSISTLSINTAAAQQNLPLFTRGSGDYNEPVPDPPAARRAASTGAISSHGASSQSYDASRPGLSSRQASWQPGMPLPGPPPGPPPSSSRYQSATGVPTFAQVGPSSRANNYRVPLRPPVLSPLPPTPANWSDDVSSRRTGKSPMSLHIETTNLDRPVPLPAGLNRSAAMRLSSYKGLLERRKQRRSIYEGPTAESSALTIETDPWSEAISPSVYSNEHSPILESAGPEVMSAKFERHAGQTFNKLAQRVQPSEGGRSLYLSMNDRSASFTGAGNNVIGAPRTSSKALPTPPLSQKNPASAHSILPSTASSVSEPAQGEQDSFIAQASHRHHEFLLRESQATSDLDRLRLFMTFIIGESNIRRQRYPGPFVDGMFDADMANQRLFNGTLGDVSRETEIVATETDHPRQTPEIDSSSHPEATWWREFRPALSPIASMSNDELSSRGRTASRWWQSQTGSETDGGTKTMKRTKRESKYMGLSTLSVQEVLSAETTPREFHDINHVDDAYPEEKGEKVNQNTFGLYTEGAYDPTRDRQLSKSQAPSLLDISRFITLPPPYPRHYPAINNGHPRLSTYRNAVRTLSDLNELQSRRSRHNVAVEALRAEHVRTVNERQQSFQAHVQVQISEGSISYAEAAEAEQALRLEDHKAEKECLQAEFDTLQDVLINPMHDMLNDRITQVSAKIDDLTKELVAEMHGQNVDRPQQEGDAMPEILEYLTQLKWLFETREHMHREVFDLLSERNEKYKAIVLLPYRQVNNLDKLRDTDDFFTRDGLERRTRFFAEAAVRYERFVQLVAENVAREVDLQSSAFWDIAPLVLDLVQRLPNEPEQLGAIEIPEAEYAETPSYRDFPQQYLYSLLEHAEKSTYQFIESQISLHCLLHEVKGALIGAQCRAAEAANARETRDRRGDDTSQNNDIKDWQIEQETSATAELKQQVTMIEEQWYEALGSALQAKKGQVKMCLEKIGGWDESLEMEA
ncbi:hypothetical protein A1O1_06011 [Capronia coronata CBS 617.96]|uniref:Uncharacterized protein n=1 Tax=Capronia coronata CBS 617.96 TaxID=1182541 RepID=W9Y7M8_9EURO|nr:uncharacterized protein A1O1_06011 [Capronia coronata CBS 617.96]EXJ85645.1 hypothetical protein A1O1_06011 [Capronia coronata CBS 617.96]